MNAEVKHSPDTLLNEAASLFQLLGGMAAKHLVIVGGMVPPLLVPDASRPHIGSADIDLCFSLAITEGATRRYYKSIEELIEPHFEPVPPSGFRWRKKGGVAGVPLLIDFLAPASADAAQLPDATRELGDTAAENAGTRLRPFPIRSGWLIDEDAIAGTVEGVDLVYEPGVRSDVRIRHAGPVGFLAAKADAFAGRTDSKDGYDVSWWCLHAAGTPEEVAQRVIERPSFKAGLFQESVAQLRAAFRAPDYPGPSGYASEVDSFEQSGFDPIRMKARMSSAFRASASQVESSPRLVGRPLRKRVLGLTPAPTDPGGDG